MVAVFHDGVEAISTIFTAMFRVAARRRCYETRKKTARINVETRHNRCQEDADADGAFAMTNSLQSTMVIWKADVYSNYWNAAFHHCC
jgi:hypothetical protein